MQEEFNLVTQVVLPLSLAFIMFSLGLALTVADFKRVLVQPKDFIIGALGQVVLLPLVAFAIVSVWDLDPALAVGVMVIAACPGGVTSNMMTHLGRGDTALSVSLTAVISVATVLTLPFIVGFSLTHFMDAETVPDLSVVRTVTGVFLITTVPVVIGMTVRHFAVSFTQWFEPKAQVLATVLFALVIIGAAVSEWGLIVEHFATAGPVVVVLNLAMMVLAFLLARASGLGQRQRTAITLECGLQNGTLAIFVAVTLLGNTTMMVPGGLYSLIMFASAVGFMLLARRQAA